MLTPQQVSSMRSKYGLDSTGTTAASTGSRPIGSVDYAANSVQKQDKGMLTPNSVENPSLSGFGQNIAKSAGSLASNLGQVIAHPIKTAEAIGKTALGVAEKVIPGRQASEEHADAIGQFFKDRYGSLEALKKTAYEDPVGLALDIATIFEGGGAALKAAGTASKIEGVAKAGQMASKAGEAINPIRIATETAKEGISSIRKGTSAIGNKAQEIISPIDQGTKTILEKPASQKIVRKPTQEVTEVLDKEKMTPVPAQPTTRLKQLEDYQKVAEEALKDYSKPTPMELAGRKGEEALSAIKDMLNEAGQAKKTISTAMSKTDTGSIVSDAMSKMKTMIKDRVGLTFDEMGNFKNAANRLNTVSDRADLDLIKKINFKLKQLENRPTFQRVDDAIDWMQDILYKRSGNTAIPINSKVESVIKETVRELNSKLKEIGGPEYTAHNEAYSYGKDVYEKLNKALGIEGNKGASLMKQLFSPAGTAPRKLFEQIKEITGMDLVDEATLAKFVMENVGDVRQASLLEQVLKGGSVPTNAKGLIQYAAEKTIGKLKNPIGRAKGIVEKSEKSTPAIKPPSFKQGTVPQTVITSSDIGKKANLERIEPSVAKPLKSGFKSPAIRPLTRAEVPIKNKIDEIKAGKVLAHDIATIAPEVSFDNKARPLILSYDAVKKITSDHGEFNIPNLIVTSKEPDYIIKNFRGNTDKINIIKKVPNSRNYLLISAEKQNGFYVLTHYETTPKSHQQLKNLLKEGDVIDYSGETPVLPDRTTVR